MEEPNSLTTVKRGRAVPFVIYSNKKFIVTDEAREVLCREDYRNISIISLVGKYRTGKSFLLNRVLLNQKRENGFDVGPTIRPCTKGIWMWSEPMYVENNHCKEKFPVFMIDTEGLGAYDEEINHDSKIFLIAVLISSLFIFNSFGNIDENAINSLSFILNLSKTIKLSENSSNNDSELAKCFPSLLWLLRDFSLKLEDSEGNTITAKQYLENGLQLIKGSSDFVESKNQVRKMIQNYFPERDCFALVRPVEDEKDLQNLQSLDDSKIRREFQEQAETLRNKVSKKVKPKMLNNRLLNGNMLVELLKSILDSINQGSIPVIESSWKYVMHNECIKNINEIQEKFLKSIKKFRDENKENQTFFMDLEVYERSLEKKLIEEFQKSTVLDETVEIEYIQKLKSKFQEEIKKFNEENSKFFENKMMEGLEKNTKKLIDTFETDKYAKNYYQFFQDLENLKEITEASTPDFKLKKEIIFERMIHIVKKFIEMNFLKNKILNEKEIVQLKNEVNSLQSKYNILNEEVESSKIESKESSEKLNSHIVDLKTREKNLEDKYKLLETEKKNILTSNEKKLNELRKEHNESLEKLKREKEKLEADMRSKDDQIMTLKFSEEKMSSLNNMKVEFYEKEITSHKERNEQLKREILEYRNDNEDLLTKLETLKIENSKLRVLEVEIEKLKSENIKKPNRQILESPTKEPEQEFMNLFKNSVENSNSQLSSTVKMFDEILSCIRQQNIGDLINSNKILTDSLAQTESRYSKLEETVEKMRKLKKLVKSCSGLQCRFCAKLFSYEAFKIHSNCKKEEKTSEPSLPENIRIKILKGVLNKDELGKAFIDYIVEVLYNSQTWRVNKKFPQFSNLHKMLKNGLVDVKQPESANIFSKVEISKDSNHHESKIKSLEKYLKDISEIPIITKSKIFRKFFEFEEEEVKNFEVLSANLEPAFSDEDLVTLEEGKSHDRSEDSEKKEVYQKKMTTSQSKILTMNLNMMKNEKKKYGTNGTNTSVTKNKPKQGLNSSMVLKEKSGKENPSTGKLNSSMIELNVEKTFKKRNSTII